MDKLTVVILNWNGKKDTLECLASLPKDQAVVVVDNGSTDDSVKAIREKFPQVTLLETGENLGYAGGNNVGIVHALKHGADLVLILNNDTTLEPTTLTALIQEADRHPEAAIFGGWPLRYYERDKLDHLGGLWNPKKAEFDLIGLGEHKEFSYIGPLDYVCGCSILVRREVFEKIGLLEPKFFLFWEEADFCARAQRAGFRLRVCKEAKIYHKVSASFTGGKPHIAYYWWRGRFLWIQRNASFAAWKTVLPQIFHLYKLWIIKSLFHRKSPQLPQYRAAVAGFHDYLLRRFSCRQIRF
jgi:GT2 family glycosyltransferase